MLMIQILADIYDCPDLINDAELLAEAAKTAARAVGATIVGEMRSATSRTASP